MGGNEPVEQENKEFDSMLKRLKSLERGQIFSAGGFNWLVVEHNQHGTLALMEKCLMDAAFDEENSNDWRQSSSRRYLNENFLQVLEDNGLGPDNIIETEVDLTADDGLKDYGTSIDKVFLLAADMYRKNRDVIEPIDVWWWLITPYSTPTAGYARSVRIVCSVGSLSYGSACSGYGGLRPALILKSDILVSIEGDHENIEVDETTAAGIELTADYCVRLAKSAGITTEQLISMVANAAKEKGGDEWRN